MLWIPSGSLRKARVLVVRKPNTSHVLADVCRRAGFAASAACALALMGCRSANSTPPDDTALRASDTKPISMNLGGGAKADLAAMPVDIGVDIYPGAAPSASPGSTISAPEGSIKVASYTTKDSIDQVFEFYKSKFGATAVANRGTGDNHKMATVFKVEGKSRLTVTITRQDGADVTALDIKNVTEN